MTELRHGKKETYIVGEHGPELLVPRDAPELLKKPFSELPHLVMYQTRGQLPLTALAIVLILTAVFVGWFLSQI